MRRQLLLVIISCLLGVPITIQAQTPEASPVTTEDQADNLNYGFVMTFENLEGFEQFAMRGAKWRVDDAEGIYSFSTLVARFDSTESAEHALPLLQQSAIPSGMWQDASVFGTEDDEDDYFSDAATSITKIGDERFAYLFETDEDDFADEWFASVIYVREANYLYITSAWSRQNADCLDAAVDLTASILVRTEGGAVQENSQGMLTGGLWDLLPDLNDYPAGFHHIADHWYTNKV